MTTRESFLQRVRQAVQQGNRPGSGASLEPRGEIGYQGAGLDPVARFGTELTAAGGRFSRVADAAAATATVLELVRQKGSRRILLGREPLLDSLHLAEPLRAAGVEVLLIDPFNAESAREPFFSADLGISGVAYLIAETGSVVTMTEPAQSRSVSLLPPVHIAVAERKQLLPDLFDLFARLQPETMPSCVTLITGPSKTGDIELRLVTGVHGPGEVHVVLIDG
jgi:L-lactate dehydrogenase complex protein LldG